MSIPEAQRHAHTDVSPESADGEPWRDTVFIVGLFGVLTVLWFVDEVAE